MIRLLAALACAAALGFEAAAAMQPIGDATTTFRITKTEWTDADEQGYSAFVQALGEENCHSVYGCLTSKANPWRFTDGPDLDVNPDCADLPYILRAYYAAKNGLPFSYAGTMSPLMAGEDPRYSATGNMVDERFDVVDTGAPIALNPLIQHMVGVVSTASMRVNPQDHAPYQQDFYSPRIAPGAIRPGTVIYDVNGHAVVVYKVEADGRILFMESFPDRSFGRGVYGAQFPRTGPELGSGFKNFRPAKLVGAVRRPDGTLHGGSVVLARNSEIKDVSLEQYLGSDSAGRDWRSARFAHAGVKLDFPQYVRASLSAGGLSFDPVAELQNRMRGICSDLKTRAGFVARAVSDGVDREEAPPGGVFDSHRAPDWGVNSSWGRDARLRAAYADLAETVAAFARMWESGDPHLKHQGDDLRSDLEKAFRAEDRACAFAYRNSAGKPVTLTFSEVGRRLFALSFDPYHCIERRWGASGRELRSCRESANERRWYEAQQPLRNRTTDVREMTLRTSLADLEAKAAGAAGPVDIAKSIAAIGRRGKTARNASGPGGAM